MQETDDEWVQPTPVRVAIREAVSGETNVERAELGNIEEYVDREALHQVLDDGGNDELRVRIEGHEVTIHASGDIQVE